MTDQEIIDAVDGIVTDEIVNKVVMPEEFKKYRNTYGLDIRHQERVRQVIKLVFDELDNRFKITNLRNTDPNKFNLALFHERIEGILKTRYYNNE